MPDLSRFPLDKSIKKTDYKSRNFNSDSSNSNDSLTEKYSSRSIRNKNDNYNNNSSRFRNEYDNDEKKSRYHNENDNYKNRNDNLKNFSNSRSYDNTNDDDPTPSKYIWN